MRVFLENLEILAGHGVYEVERLEGRRFRVDATVDVDQWPTSDDPSEILDYRRLARIVREVFVDGPPRNLIETLAWDILNRTFSENAQVQRMELTVRKAATGVPGDPEWVGISAFLDRAMWAEKRGSG